MCALQSFNMLGVAADEGQPQLSDGRALSLSDDLQREKNRAHFKRRAEVVPN